MKSLIENLSKSKVVQNCVVEINFVVIILYVRSGMNEFLNLKYYTFSCLIIICSPRLITL